MTEAGWTVCIECGMMCEAVEYHPYAACLMFKQCLNSETVRANLQAVRDDSYQQGQVAGLREAKTLVEKVYDDAPDKSAVFYEVCLDIAAKLAQQAQDEKGVGDGGKTER